LGAFDLELRLPPEVTLARERLDSFAGPYREPLGSQLLASVRDGGIDLAYVATDDSTSPPVHLRPAGPDWFVVRDGDDRGDSAEFLRGGRLLRYAWLFERVPG